MDLDECFRKGLIKKTEINIDLIKSLIEMANINENTVKMANVNRINVSSYVSLSYDSLRGVLEALCVLNGYKVLSHICMGELLKSIISEFDYEGFDRIRWIRNSINYYGEKVEFGPGKEIINKIFSMKKQVLNKYLKKVV